MLRARRYEDAILAARRATELEPDLVESRAVEGRALLLAGRLEECLRIAFGPRDAIRAMCRYSAGRHTDAAAIADSITRALEARAPADTAYTEIARADGLASYYAWTGAPGRALAWLTDAFQRSPMGVDRRVLESALFDNVRADPVAARKLDNLTRQVWGRVARTATRR
jgi:predicted Zn-dependent protease